MEEIVTVDGRQFQLSYDQPISLGQRLSVIEDIKKSMGCKSCSQTRQISKLAATCPAVAKGSGSQITLNAAPMDGVAPYTVTFYKKVGTNAPVQIGTKNGVGEAPDAGTGMVIPALSYTLTDDDVAGSTGDPTPSITDLPYVSTALTAGNIRIITTVTDSCTGTGGPATCTDFCDVPLTCVSPTCNPIIQ